MGIKKLIIIVWGIFFSLVFLNAKVLVINKSAGNMPSSLVPGLSSSNSSNNGGSVGSLVDSLYDAAADEDPFTFTQNVLGNEYTGVSANCTDYKCTVAEINGERWMVHHTDNDNPSYNTIQLYKEDSDDSITLYPSYEGGTTIDPSREDAEQLQQLLDESIALFNES